MDTKNEAKKNGTGIEAFDRKNLAILRGEIDAALDGVGKKFGISLKLGRATFATNFAKFALEASTIGESGEPVDEYASCFRGHEGKTCDWIYPSGKGDSLVREVRFRQGDLFREVRIGAIAYKIVGLNPRAQKMPILLQAIATGKRYKFAASTIAYALDALDSATPETSRVQVVR